MFVSKQFDNNYGDFLSMNHKLAFQDQTELIKKFGESEAYLIWVVSMYLDHPDSEELGSLALTEGTDDKKIDLITIDRDHNRIVFAQGYYSTIARQAAPANKASDLNTASAWLFSGD